MFVLTSDDRAAVERLCRDCGVRRLDLFGSATSAGFDPDRSDLDFLVEFLPGAEKPWMGEYTQLQESLEQLFERKVDLVWGGGLKNPYFRREALRSWRRLYESAEREASV